MSSEFLDKYKAEKLQETAEQREYSFDETIPKSAIHGPNHEKVWIDGEEYHILFRKLVNDIVRGKAPIIKIHGQRRSGKTVVLCYIAWTLHERIGVLGGEWDPSSNLCYKLSPYLERTRNYLREFIAVDEAGEILSSDNYNTDYNRINDDTLETMGVMGHVNAFISTNNWKLDPGIKKRDHIKLVATDDDSNYSFDVTRVDVDNGARKFTINERDLGTFQVPKSKFPPKRILKAYTDKELEYKLSTLEENQEKSEEIEQDSEEDSW